MVLVAEWNGRPDHPALRLDQLPDERVPVVRLGLEFAAELGLRVAADDRKVERAVEPDDEGLVVGDEFRRQAGHEHGEEDPQAPEAAPIAAEVLQPPPIQPRDADAEKAILRRGRRLSPHFLPAPGCGRVTPRRAGHRQVSRLSKSMRGSTMV